MVQGWRQGVVFGGGLLLGVAAGVAFLIGWQQTAPSAEPRETQSSAQQAGLAGVSLCGAELLLPATGERDGQFAPPSDVTDQTATDVAVYIGVGHDAAREGRVRDAEAALMASCRIAAGIRGPGSPELGGAKYELARHYLAASAAAPAHAGVPREALLQRAQTLFEESLQAYSASMGASHEKARLAAAGLTLARQVTALAGPLEAAAQAQAQAQADHLMVASAPEPAASVPTAAPAPATAPRREPAPVPRREPATAQQRQPADTAAMGAPPAREPAVAPRAAPAPIPALPREMPPQRAPAEAAERADPPPATAAGEATVAPDFDTP